MPQYQGRMTHEFCTQQQCIQWQHVIRDSTTLNVPQQEAILDCPNKHALAEMSTGKLVLLTLMVYLCWEGHRLKA